MKSPEDFSDRLKLAMEKAQKTRNDLIELTGLSRQAVNKWLDGESGLRMEQLFVVADFLTVEPRWLATGKGEMKLGKSGGCDHADIPQRRIDLIRMYGRLSDEDRMAARRFIETMAWFEHPRKDEYIAKVAKVSISPSKSSAPGIKPQRPPKQPNKAS